MNNEARAAVYGLLSEWHAGVEGDTDAAETILTLGGAIFGLADRGDDWAAIEIALQLGLHIGNLRGRKSSKLREEVAATMAMADMVLKWGGALPVPSTLADVQRGRNVVTGASAGGKAGGRGRPDDGRLRAHADDICRAVEKVGRRNPTWTWTRACRFVAEASAGRLSASTVKRHAKSVYWPAPGS